MPAAGAAMTAIALERSLPARLAMPDRLGVMLLISATVHLIFLFGVKIAVPELKAWRDRGESLEVVLVNSKTASRPTDTKVLAQANLDGGGNTDQDRRAKTPLPVLDEKAADEAEQAEQRVAELEQAARQVMTQLSAQATAAPEKQIAPAQTLTTPAPNTENIVQKSLDLVKLEAEINRDYDEYQKRPRRTFIGARAKEYRFTRYVEDWRDKVERWGNLNYPEAAKTRKIYGQLQLTVSIKADGSIDNVEIDRSSGYKLLDDAAVKIVRDAGRNGYAPLPADIRVDTDVLHITRTWSFTREDQLKSPR